MGKGGRGVGARVIKGKKKQKVGCGEGQWIIADTRRRFFASREAVYLQWRGSNLQAGGLLVVACDGRLEGDGSHCRGGYLDLNLKHKLDGQGN